MATFRQKLQISAGSAGLFALVNLPFVYKLTNNALPFSTYNETTECPSNIGLVLHALVFFVLTFLMMGNPTKKVGIKLKHSLYGTLIFFLLSSPAVFDVVNSVIGPYIEGRVTAINGCPTHVGILLHTFVYCATLIAVMYLPEADK